jgi:hypothetical protein
LRIPLLICSHGVYHSSDIYMVKWKKYCICRIYAVDENTYAINQMGKGFVHIIKSQAERGEGNVF